eukprot:evm.model.NODE_46957_length_1400_cov_7.067143.1
MHLPVVLEVVHAVAVVGACGLAGIDRQWLDVDAADGILLKIDLRSVEVHVVLFH